VITIGDDIPSAYCINANTHALARYAALSQEAGIVPIVEPEVLIDGGHDIDRCYEVTEDTLRQLYETLELHRVDLKGTLLKPNMVVSGKDSAAQADVEEVAEKTIACLKSGVPAGVPGILFLSGGMSDEEASARLNAMNQKGPHPWELSFSYGRALQAPALKAWKGESSNLKAAQGAFYHRAKCNGAARSGSYTAEMESAA
jgi:fructose-bisphosphate aldolase class I